MIQNRRLLLRNQQRATMKGHFCLGENSRRLVRLLVIFLVYGALLRVLHTLTTALTLVDENSRRAQVSTCAAALDQYEPPIHALSILPINSICVECSLLLICPCSAVFLFCFVFSSLYRESWNEGSCLWKW